MNANSGTNRNVALCLRDGNDRDRRGLGRWLAGLSLLALLMGSILSSAGPALAVSDPAPASAPGGVFGTPHYKYVDLYWWPVKESDIVAYRVTWATSLSGPWSSPYNTGTAVNAAGFVTTDFGWSAAVKLGTTGSWTKFKPGTTYYFRVVALDSAGQVGPAATSSAVTTLSCQRGDANSDGYRDNADVSFLLNHLYVGGPAPKARDCGDANGDRTLDLSDPVYLNAWLWKGGPAPPP